jgi:hypothetical protein
MQMAGGLRRPNVSGMSIAKSPWTQGLRGDPALLDALTIRGPANVLLSAFAVTAFAAEAVGVATLAAAELLQARSGGSLRSVTVDTIEAAAAFRSEALFEPIGWERPPTWDPIAGDYRAADRWIRLHTNYASHRAAALAVLETPADKAAVAAAVARWDAAKLESAIALAGGCAAAMYTREEWRVHPHGSVVIDEPAIAIDDDGSADGAEPRSGEAPLSGVRVLDLTRVIAGPVCTRFLAAHGAEVLRIDPPGFEEVGALLPETTAGKRCATIAIDTTEGAARFAALVAQADVLVCGLRPSALERLGFGPERLRQHNPRLIVARLDAYGWRGPWRGRRGFDSLVQMSTGIAADNHDERPSPLPAQALDHGIGYLLAAGVCRALTLRVNEQRISTVRGALLGAANHLFMHRTACRSASEVSFADTLEPVDTFWGPVRRVRCPGAIDGLARPTWRRPPGPLGRDQAAF